MSRYTCSMTFIEHTVQKPQFGAVDWPNGATPAQVRRVLAGMAGYAPTPTRNMPALANRFGIESLALKDETARFGLGAFKGVGAFYAVAMAVFDEVERCTGTRPLIKHFDIATISDITATMTLTCATAGNHGAAVAAAAKMLGCQAVIYVPRDAAPSRIAIIAAQGARVVQLEDNYDACVEACSTHAKENGWHIVSDTSWSGYERVPKHIMQGYSLIADEAAAALDRPPTHIFLQGGVGSFAGAIAGFARADARLKDARIIIVEPEHYACLQASAEIGAAVELTGEALTQLSPLACLRPSDLGWQVLDGAADGFLSVADAPALEAMRVLAAPQSGDPQIIAGAAGCGGLAALFAAEKSSDLRAALDLDTRSRVLAFITEGRNDDRVS